ncbi:prephenate dehydrogenase/arogenate dehydrogenase family protein [Halobacteriovorax sp. ZH5_bin.2]|uniref:prephenate dehydrogenase/arogenate dehydrogenase family protein n=1 Tax=unclassified Halobacteriovorax TaxID=2639665 RepID=UPI003716B3A4
MKVGIIGFGRLGKLISKYLEEDFTVEVYDINEGVKAEIEAMGCHFKPLEEVCKNPIVIPFVPMNKFESVIEEIAPLLSKDALVVDVCSVKEMPVAAMKKHLPETVSILATHPMFGPDSAGETLFGTKIAVCPVRIEDKYYQKICAFMRFHGIKVIETTAAEHDKQISHSLLLTHMIGRTLMDMDAKKLPIDTKGYRRLLKILKTVENDSWELFADMNEHNQYAKQTREDFLESFNKVIKRLED